MRVLLNAFGSRGEVQPMIALAVGLKARGHHPIVAAGVNFRGAVESQGLEFIGALIDAEEMTRKYGLGLRFLRETVPIVQSQFAFIEAAPKVDLVVGSGLAAISNATHAEALGVPGVFAMFFQHWLPSAFHPPMGFPWRSSPWLNRLLWGIQRRMLNLARGPVNRWREHYGLPPLRDLTEHFLASGLLLAADASLTPLPSDAPAGLFQCGPWLLKEQGEIDPKLESFLQAGPAPVYIGFGSMPDLKAARTTALLVRAVGAAGVRAILSSGWAGFASDTLPPSVHLVGSVPHDKLLPRCSVVIHHGGAGTTHAAVRAGVPQIVVPHGFDQWSWARSVHEAGVAPAPIPRNRLSAARLEHAIRRCLTDTAMQQRARELSPRLRMDGVERAVEYLEALEVGR